MLFRSLVVFHVAVSLIGIVTGLVVLCHLLAARPDRASTGAFLATTLLTSLTGFLFPAERLMISHALGIMSLIALAIAIPALYWFRLTGIWRWLYVAGAVTALYLNVLAVIGEAFMRLPFLKPLAPTLSEAPFLVAQSVALAAFLVLGVLAAVRFRPPTTGPDPIG